VIFKSFLEELGRVGIYTHTLLGYITASLDPFAQVVLIILYLFYMSWKAKRDEGAYGDVAKFMAGYLAHELGIAITA